MVPSYDPELNLIYVGTSVSSPAPKFMLGGNEQQHLYHNSTLALDVSTGRIVWYYQHLIDHWDLDHPYERLLVDTRVAPEPTAVAWINPGLRPGELRKVLTGIPGKTGVVYTLDRQTGEFLWATPTVRQTVIADIDGATGLVKTNPDMLFNEVGDERFVCPSQHGGKNWPAGSYSPLTNMMYFPLQNSCETLVAMQPGVATGGPVALYAIRGRAQITPNTLNLGTVHAISVETGATTWKHEQRARTMSLLATGGGLLFGGDVNGRFRAYDQRTGRVLWEINLGSSVTGYPITYAVDSRQYVAVSTGTSNSGALMINLTPELRPSSGNTIFVFALPNR